MLEPTPRALVLNPPLEWRSKRMSYAVLAAGFVVAYFLFLLCFWAPAHPGVDQNGYLVGGKLFSQTFSTGFKPQSPFNFVGWMWIRTSDGWYYPKYPLGMPILTAIAMWLGGKAHAITWPYLIPTISTALSLVAMYRLTRLVASSFASLLATILLAFNGVTLILANSPGSHAPALCFVTWGMYVLVRWWQRGTWWRGFLAAFLLGYAMTIRYTEGLLVLPIAFVIISSIRWRKWRSYVEALSPVIGWMIPVVGLVAFNWFAMHSLTGYDSTHESTGFTWKAFVDNWDFTLSQLDNGMFFLFPIAVLGMVLMFRASWRFALLMMLWMLPGVLLYTSYYWNGTGRAFAFLRFFLTLFPPLIIGAAWLFDQFVTIDFTQGRPERSGGRHLRRSIVAPIAAGIIVAFASGVSLHSNLGGIERDYVINANLADTTDHVLARIPSGSMVFGEGRMLLNDLQFVGDYHLFAPEAFSAPFGRRMAREGDPNQPTPLQYARRQYMHDIYEKMDDKQLIAEASRLLRTQLQSGRRAFFVVPSFGSVPFVERLPKEFSSTVIDHWREPAEMSDRAKRAFEALGPFALMLGRTSQPMRWQIWEIKEKSPPSGRR